MSKVLWSGAVLSLIIINIALLSRTREHVGPWNEDYKKTDSKEMQNLRAGRRVNSLFITHEPFDLIGALVTNRHWNEVLQLDEDQAEAIKKLDNVLQNAREFMWKGDADHPVDDLESYKAYLARSDQRRSSSIRHGQRMVSLGLLTERQSSFVLQRYLTQGRPMQKLFDENIQELLAITAAQNRQLTRVAMDENADTSDIKFIEAAMSPDDKIRKQAGAFLEEAAAKGELAAKAVLTPEQLATWSKLTEQRSLPLERPEIPTPPAEILSRIQLAQISPVFRELKKKADGLQLAKEQQEALLDLEDVVRKGLYWMSLASTDTPIPNSKNNLFAQKLSESQRSFIKHAEHVALKGILTQDQAKEIHAAVN